MVKGPFSFYDEDAIKQLLEEAGFKKITIEKVSKMGETDSVDNIINGFIKGSPLAAYLNEKDSHTQRQITTLVRQALISKFGEYNLKIPLQAWVCKGIKE